MNSPEEMKAAVDKLFQLGVRPANEIVDDEVWKRLSEDSGLPETARAELVELIREESGRRDFQSWFSIKPPSETRKELSQLHTLARKLVDGLEQLGVGAGTLLWQAFTYEFYDENLGFESISTSQTHFEERFKATVAETAWIRDRLFDAIQRGSVKQSSKGGDPALRNFLRLLDRFLIREKKPGLIRASVASKKSGRADACARFCRMVCNLALGVDLNPQTLDDALKDVIRTRPKPVGRDPIF